MSKLIADEIKVAFTTKTKGYKPDRKKTRCAELEMTKMFHSQTDIIEIKVNVAAFIRWLLLAIVLCHVVWVASHSHFLSQKCTFCTNLSSWNTNTVTISFHIRSYGTMYMS